MREVIKKVYYCDFCSKKYFQKPVMIFHEKYCGQNPNNRHICLQDCENLMVHDYKDEYTGDIVQKEFYCVHFDYDMYSYKAEAIVEKNKDQSWRTNSRKHLWNVVNHGTRMPLECQSYNRGHLGNQTSSSIAYHDEVREEMICEMELATGALKHSDM